MWKTGSLVLCALLVGCVIVPICLIISGFVLSFVKSFFFGDKYNEK